MNEGPLCLRLIQTLQNWSPDYGLWTKWSLFEFSHFKKNILPGLIDQILDAILALRKIREDTGRHLVQARHTIFIIHPLWNAEKTNNVNPQKLGHLYCIIVTIFS